jgi:hypothetical protein
VFVEDAMGENESFEGKATCLPEGNKNQTLLTSSTRAPWERKAEEGHKAVNDRVGRKKNGAKSSSSHF